MSGGMKVDNCCFSQPLASEKYSTIVEGVNLSRFETGGYADENNRRPTVPHYESFPLEDPDDQVSMVTVPSSVSISSRFKTALGQRNVLTKSASLPSADNIVFDLPDPFPELSQDCLAPVSARIYGTETSSSLPNSPEKQPEQRTATHTNGGFPRATGCGLSYRTVNHNINCTSQNKTSVDIYVDAQKCYSVAVDDNTTVANVCDHLDQMNHSKRDPFWTIVEHVDKFNIERSLEDHELLYPILKSWHLTSNRLYFRKDYCRYELFSNPNQCFPEKMLDVKLPKEDSTSFMTHSELYRNLLLKCLLANQSMPDIQGFLHLRNGKKGWKKYFCVLRHSGLYYITKGCAKDSQRMVLLSDLTNDNIYVALNSKKTFGAPTQHCFCLAPSHDVNDKHKLRQFCADDEQSRLCWTTGMRFIKFGAQLHENCTASVSCDYSRRESTTSEQTVGGCNSRNCDKVVINPVFKVPSPASQENYQGNRQRSFLSQLQKLIPRIVDSPSTDALSSVLQTSISSHGGPRNLEWFHDMIGRDDAVSLLCNNGLKDGTFLVRHSQTLSGVYVLSFVHNGTVKHCTIHKIKLEDCLYYSLDGGSTKFMDLSQLLDFYRLNAGRLPTRLTRHITRLS